MSMITCLSALAVLSVTPGAMLASQGEGTLVTAFENGRWFDGEGFEPGTRYVADGVLHREPPRRVGQRIDLQGQWVVPPYGEAHTHLLEPDVIDEYNALYLRRGIFYARDQNNAISLRSRFGTKLDEPDTIDFISANQGFTGPGGHPIQIALQCQALGLFPKDWTMEQLDGDTVFVVEDVAEIDEVWPRFLAGEPDFVKIFLVYSELHAERSGNPEYLYECGLDPDLARPIVERAHAAGLDVSAHIYTRADFRTAIDAGVDMIAHFPGVGYDQALGDEHFLLMEEDAELAASRGVTVATTLSDMVGWPGTIGPATRALVDRVIVPNLGLLQSAGVEIVIGTDRIRLTSDTEVGALAALDLFDPLTLLRMWCIDTPRSIFPERRIGGLDDGYEASFLVLEGDPLEDFANTQRIALRMKQGQMLFPREPSFPPLGAPAARDR